MHQAVLRQRLRLSPPRVASLHQRALSSGCVLIPCSLGQSQALPKQGRTFCKIGNVARSNMRMVTSNRGRHHTTASASTPQTLPHGQNPPLFFNSNLTGLIFGCSLQIGSYDFIPTYFSVNYYGSSLSLWRLGVLYIQESSQIKIKCLVC